MVRWANRSSFAFIGLGVRRCRPRSLGGNIITITPRNSAADAALVSVASRFSRLRIEQPRLHADLTEPVQVLMSALARGGSRANRPHRATQRRPRPIVTCLLANGSLTRHATQQVRCRVAQGTPSSVGVDEVAQNQGMRPWKATREHRRGDRDAERERSVYVRILLERVRDATYVPSRRHATSVVPHCVRPSTLQNRSRRSSLRVMTSSRPST